MLIASGPDIRSYVKLWDKVLCFWKKHKCKSKHQLPNLGFGALRGKCLFEQDVYIDYQKAFDTINHNIHLKKIELYGFSNSSLKWFRSYLGGLSQMTKCDNIYLSSPQPVTIGVPQGSTLGPLLFIIYVNDLSNIKHHFDVKMKMYADETVIYAQGESVNVVKCTLQSCIDHVYKWCISNRL